MDICTRCAGTGRNGNCEVCGGSGFVSTDTFIAPHAAPVVVNIETTPVAKGKPRRKIQLKTPNSANAQHRLPNPMALAKDEQIGGLRAEHLSFPLSHIGFKQKAIRQQIKALTTKLKAPLIRNIRWESPGDCIVTMANGKVHREKFGQRPEFAMPPPQDRPRVNPGDVPAERAPKMHHRTIPHPSQVATKPKPQTNQAKAKRVVRVVRDGVVVAVIENPRSVWGKHGGKARSVERAPREMSPRGTPDTPTAFELAFAAVRGDLLDGSREWGGLRDVSNGSYGSHPAFDASDDTIDT